MVSTHAGGLGVFGGEGAERSPLGSSVPGTVSRLRRWSSSTRSGGHVGGSRCLQGWQSPYPGTRRGSWGVPSLLGLGSLCPWRELPPLRGLRAGSSPSAGVPVPAAETRAALVPCEDSALTCTPAGGCCRGADRLLGQEQTGGFW